MDTCGRADSGSWGNLSCDSPDGKPAIWNWAGRPADTLIDGYGFDDGGTDRQLHPGPTSDRG
jgi:hypothetical protein